MSARRWTFTPFDSWFFRESRPHGLLGGIELSSFFPPPARTVAGAVRTAIGEHAGVRWAAYNRGDGRAHRLQGLDLIAEMGDAGSFGRLRLGGPYLVHEGRRLYPAPSLLARSNSDFCRLSPGATAVRCDLGTVRLPEAPVDAERPRSLAEAWVTLADFQRVLRGGVPEKVLCTAELRTTEPRLGIGREIGRRTVAEGLLYATRHVRPAPRVEVEVEVSGIDAALQPTRALLRFGGEGRPAAITTAAADPAAEVGSTLDPGPAPAGARGLALVLLTHADLDGDWKPPGFVAAPGAGEDAGVTVFRGELAGVPLTLVSAALGKAVREGGWDLAAGAPRAVVSLVPRGSTWFCRTEGDLEAAARALRGPRIGRDTEIGRGEIAVGYWL